jgi:hypothetical protein
MSLLANLATDESIASEKDSVGSGGAIDSGLYLSTITLAYVTKAASDAMGLVFHAKTEEGREVRQTLWMTSGKDKGCKNYYEDKNGEKHYLPGFNHANSLALLTLGKEISALETETKVVNVYNKDAKAEVPTKVEMLVDLLGQQVILGVIKQTVDKTSKGDDGKYHPTGETREENEIDKIFRARDKMTTAEIRAQATEPAFYDTWDAKWTGKVKDKATKASGTAGAPKAGGAAAAKPKASLFA